MVEYSEHNAKRPFAKLFDYFVSIVDMIVVTTVIFLLVSIEAVISSFIHFAPFSTAWQLCVFAAPSLPLLNVEVVYCLILLNLLAFILC